MKTIFNEISEIDQLAKMNANWLKSLALLRHLKAGTVTLDQVTLTEDSWNVNVSDAPVVSVETKIVPTPNGIAERLNGALPEV